MTGLKFRLPTEAEWEYSAKGGENYKFAGSDTFDEVAWFGNNSSEQTHPVGKKKPNGFGLYDMSGNVSEWCSDWYDEQYYKVSPVINPQGPSSNNYLRVNRGGCWNESFMDRCRLTYRGSCIPNTWAIYGMGLRLILIKS